MADSSPNEPYIDPSCTALLVIDMQKGFCDPESQMEKAGIGTENQRAILPDVLKLVDLARELEIPVLWSQQIHYPGDVTRRRRRIPSHIDKQHWAPCLRGTWEVDFVDEVAEAIRPEDLIVEKHRASVFFETTLDTKLRMLGAEQIIISGCNTDFCVETTIRDGYYRDMDVIVVSDCVAGPRKHFHDDTLAKVETYFGAVVALDDLPAAIIPGRRGVAATLAEAPV
ncbi:MAG TPA: isochorismatase family cysteine hydrolase [Solirubrobacterales bacterium]|nr:isochorismatase family cysteine hydrolase [Solirubrobacterales bacterium]